MSTIKTAIWYVIRKLDFMGLILRFYHNSVLLEDGWYRSYREGKPVDREGNPLPWYTYPAIHFLEPRVKPDMRVFEFGCGYSTLWFSSRVKEVVSVDNSKRWADQISRQAPKNCTVILREEQEEYVHEVCNHGLFDLIVIDGVYRDLCYSPAVQSLKDDGVIVWDNSNRSDFDRVSPQIKADGFKKVEFTGLAPNYWLRSQTSVLYQSENWMDL